MAGEEWVDHACTGGGQSMRVSSGVRILVLGWSELCRAVWPRAANGLQSEEASAAEEASRRLFLLGNLSGTESFVAVT